MASIPFAALLLAAALGPNPGDPPPQGDLTRFSLEELMALEVTSASHIATQLERTPAAVFVLSAEDIRRSGAQTIPDALRLVPGVMVARIDSNRWSVTIRGAAGAFANSILVMIDGRSVYTPLFSGTWWDVQDVPIEIIDRIEVIRGPGGVTWGANAVNGVINIITKTAESTQGGILTNSVGTHEVARGTLLYGATAGPDAYWRAYVRGFHRDSLDSSSGSDGGDSWGQGQAGFRYDRRLSPDDEVSLSGGVHEGTTYNSVDRVFETAPFLRSIASRASLRGGHVLGTWKHSIDDDSSLMLRTFVDSYDREYEFTQDDRDTFDVQLTHHLGLGDRHQLAWGFGWRRTQAAYKQTFDYRYSHDSRSEDLFNVFVQDDVTLVRDRLFLTVGAKYEHFEDVSREVQPSARLLWAPNADYTFWAAYSRAVRTPNEAERFGTFYISAQPMGPSALIIALTPDPDLEPEVVDSFELGWRNRIRESLHLDMSTFLAQHRNLVSREPGTPYADGTNMVMPFVATNRLEAVTWGAEVAVEWLPLEDLRVRSAFTWFRGDLDLDDSLHLGGDDYLSTAPRHQLSLLVMKDFGADVQTDLGAYYVDALEHGSVPAYFRLDLRTQWRPKTGVTLVAGAQSLFHDGDTEFGSSLIGSINEVEHALYFEIALGF